MSFISGDDPPDDAHLAGRARGQSAGIDHAGRRRRFGDGLRFAGPAFLVAVGYMDPGNWGTDLAAGSRFGYELLWVLVVSNALAITLQYLSVKLGVASGTHLAQAIGMRLGRRPRIVYWAVAESAMIATELAEFLGVVVALELLFGLSLPAAIAAAIVVVVALLAVGGRSARRLERTVFVLLGVIGIAYVLEVALAGPSAGQVLEGAVTPSLPSGAVVVVVGMVGATVMPHNLFLHSGLILSRRGGDPRATMRRATIETAIALNLALLVNGAILVMAAAVFAPAAIEVDSLAEAHRTLRPLLGHLAQGGFGLALLAAGLASSATGALAGQLVLDGLVGWRIPLVARRLVTTVPAIVVLSLGLNEVDALVWSQVALSLALPAVVVPLLILTSDHRVMGDMANGRWMKLAGVAVTGALCVLNGVLLVQLAL